MNVPWPAPGPTVGAVALPAPAPFPTNGTVVGKVATKVPFVGTGCARRIIRAAMTRAKDASDTPAAKPENGGERS